MIKAKRTKPARRRPARGDKTLVVLAGPNGAGKSTFWETYVKPMGIDFVNADQIAREMSSEHASAGAYDAAKAADARRRNLISAGASFCMETVFSDPRGDKVAFLREAQLLGYAVILIYIGLQTPELCLARVVQRVASGGHDVPDDKNLARYPRSLKNLGEAVRFADRAYLFDNSSVDEPFRHVATFEHGELVSRAETVPEWASGPCRGAR
jgi:predicted ABC-type ATPase